MFKGLAAPLYKPHCRVITKGTRLKATRGARGERKLQLKYSVGARCGAVRRRRVEGSTLLNRYAGEKIA